MKGSSRPILLIQKMVLHVLYGISNIARDIPIPTFSVRLPEQKADPISCSTD